MTRNSSISIIRSGIRSLHSYLASWILMNGVRSVSRIIKHLRDDYAEFVDNEPFFVFLVCTSGWSGESESLSSGVPTVICYMRVKGAFEELAKCIKRPACSIRLEMVFVVRMANKRKLFQTVANWNTNFCNSEFIGSNKPTKFLEIRQITSNQKQIKFIVRLDWILKKGSEIVAKWNTYFCNSECIGWC